jgi:dipeptidyl aminopeptidase/acylaminoacyl peptidase
MNPVWSPDSKKIAFISNKNGTFQAYIMDFPKANTKQITNMDNDVSNILWSPDGQFLSFTSDVKLQKSINEKYEKYPKANVRVYESLPIRHWDEWTDESFSHTFIIPIKGGDPIDLMKGELVDSPLKPFGGVEETGWSPDSKIYAYTAKKDSDYVLNTNSDLYLVDLSNINQCFKKENDKNSNTKCFSTENITTGMLGYDRIPKFSPDGKWIAFASQKRAGFESDKIRIMLYNRSTKEITELTEKLDQWTEEFTWSPDSKNIYAIATDSGVTSLFSFDIETKFWKRLSKGLWNYGNGLNITPNGKTLVFCKSNLNNPDEIYTMDIQTGKENKITSFNDESLKYIKPVKFESRWFTAIDGKKFQSWIVYPPDFDSTKKYPMILFCQGGPQSMVSLTYHYRWNFALFASQGYILVAPNRRGVPGFGQDWNDAISLDWGGKAMDDLLAATDQFSEEPYVDKSGRAAIGASAGGYAAYWLAGHHQKRFSAFVAHCGVFDIISKYGSTEELFFPNWEFGGPYWIAKNRENMEKNSPHNYVQNWDTPILISTGERDFRVPYTQSIEAFTAAQVQKIPSEIIIFPNETHFISHPQEFLIWFSEVDKFLDKYCKK